MKLVGVEADDVYYVSIPFSSGRERSPMCMERVAPWSFGFNPLLIGAGALPETYLDILMYADDYLVSIPFSSGRERSPRQEAKFPSSF